MPPRRPLRVKFILPALTEATSPFWRPVKYLALPAARPGHAGSLPGPGRRGVTRRRTRAAARPRRRSAGSGRDPGLHHQRLSGLPPGGSLPRAGQLRRPRRPARHVAATRGRGACRRHLPRPWGTDVPAVPGGLPLGPPASCGTSPRRGGRSTASRRFAGTSSGGATISSRTRSSSRVAVRSTAISATRTRSLPAAAPSTPSAWTMRSPRLRGCPDGTSTSSTTISSATAASARALFDGMRGMNRLFQGAATVDSILRGRSHRARGGCRAPQPVRRFRDADPGQPRQQQQAAESRPRLHGGHQTAARPRHHDQWQLRLRDGR